MGFIKKSNVSGRWLNEKLNELDLSAAAFADLMGVTESGVMGWKKLPQISVRVEKEINLMLEIKQMREENTKQDENKIHVSTETLRSLFIDKVKTMTSEERMALYVYIKGLSSNRELFLLKKKIGEML